MKLSQSPGVAGPSIRCVHIAMERFAQLIFALAPFSLLSSTVSGSQADPEHGGGRLMRRGHPLTDGRIAAVEPAFASTLLESGAHTQQNARQRLVDDKQEK